MARRSGRTPSRLAARTRFAFAAAVILATLVPGGVLRATIARALTQPADSFVADEATPLHDSLVAGDSLAPPLSRLWTVDFSVDPNEYSAASVGRVLVVGDQVYVSTNDSGGGHVYALSRATGGLLWGPAGNGGPIAYDSGEIFGIAGVYPYGTKAYALDATTGSALWSTNLPGQEDYGEPTASNGVLYAVGDGMVAIDESTGAIKWRSTWQDGTEDNVTVTDSALYYAGPCDDFFAVKPSDGSSLWTHSGSCTGGGTGSLSYHRGLLYGGGWAGGAQGLIIDATTGNQVGSYPNKAQLAFDAGKAFWLDGGNLQAYSLSKLKILWTFAGDGGLSGTPLIVNGDVYVSSSSGMLYGLHETGGVAWSAQATSGGAGLSAGSSTLLLASGSELSAWSAGGTAPAVSALTPVSGPAKGGTSVKLLGTHLTGTTGVSFGGTPATNVKVLSDSVVTATSPAAPKGSVNVTVQTPSGPATFNPGLTFTYYADAPEVSGDNAVTFRMDARHLASADGGALTLPSGKLWTQKLGGRVSYPLVVGGSVFVIVGASGSGSTNSLYALNASTGAPVWGPVSVGGAFGLTYDNGRVFTLDGNDLEQAFNANDGSFAWSVKLSQYFADSQPTAVGGVVYTGGTESGGTLYAVKETNGALIWSQGVENGDWSAPTVADGHAFVSYACDLAYSFVTADGSPTWTHYAGCEGGGGATTALYRGRLYCRDDGVVLDQLTGAELAINPAARPQTFFRDTTYFLNGSTLTAVELGTDKTLWTFTGDGGLNSDPVEANGYVYVGSGSGLVYALNARNGAVAWTGNAGSGILASGDGGSLGGGPPETGMAIGQGLLLVPAGNTLVAFH